MAPLTVTIPVNPIAELRGRLVDKRAELRDLNDRLPWTKAQAEMRAIAASGGDEKLLGSNAEARARALMLAVYADTVYTAVLGELRAVEREIAVVEASLEAAYDGRRAEEWAIRARLCDALISRGLERPGNGGTGSTVVLTEAATRRIEEEFAGRLNTAEAKAAVLKAQADQDMEDLWPQ